MIYYLVLFLLVFLGIVSLTNVKRINVLFFSVLAFFIIVMFGGLRFKVGADWDSYERIFNESRLDNLFETGIEPFFNLLIVIVKCFDLNYLFLVFLVFTFATVLKFSFLFKYSNSFFAALLIYFPIQFMAYDINGIRQGLAIGIIFCSVDSLLRKKFWTFLAIVSIAMCFHYSAVIFFPFYFIANKKIRSKYIHITIVLSIVLGFLLQKIILAFLLPRLSGLESIFAQKVFSYSSSEEFGQGIALGFSTIHRLLIFYLFFIFYDKIKLQDHLKNILLNSYLISLVLYFLFSAIEIVASRGSLYYRSFDILIIASFLTIPNKFEYKFCVFLLICIYAFFGVYTNLKLPENGLIPYDNLLCYLFR
jgi:hypothetical protein